MGKVLKKVISVVLLSSMVLSIASCSGGVKSKTSNQFKKAILDSKVGAKNMISYPWTEQLLTSAERMKMPGQ